MRKTKQTIVENISDYSKNKVLRILTKPHSPQTVTFVESLDEPWFIHVLYYRTKSGVITDTSYIIRPDVESWVSHLHSLGYTDKK